jgi:processing peptidase subunit beta
MKPGWLNNVIFFFRDDLVHYIKTHYKGSRMVLAGAGGIAHEDLCKLATQHFGKISNTYENEVPNDAPCRYTGEHFCFNIVQIKTSQTVSEKFFFCKCKFG